MEDKPLLHLLTKQTTMNNTTIDLATATAQELAAIGYTLKVAKSSILAAAHAPMKKARKK